MSWTHPMSMVGRLGKCWLVVFRMPVPEAKRWLPSGLEPVTHGNFAFWNVVICRVEQIRPWGFPTWASQTYWHVAYRIYVRHRGPQHETRGLFFVRSDCDSRLMTWGGNLLTGFRMHLAQFRCDEVARWIRAEVWSRQASARVDFDRGLPVRLSEGSPFQALAQAESVLQYPPCAISMLRNGHAQVVEVERDSAAWQTRLIRVVDQQWDFFREMDVAYELAYEVEPIDYVWRRGKAIPSRLSPPLLPAERPRPEAVVPIRSVPVWA